jgi:4-amino-4-deoxy-L-arabinose transferase-like glycosyltransferase
MSLPGRWKTSEWLIVGLVVSNGLILSPVSLELKVLGGMVLFCLVPGLALVNWLFPRPGQMNLLTRLILGMSASYVVSTLTVFVLNSFRLELTAWRLAAALDVVSAALIVGCALAVRRSGDEHDEHGPAQPENWLYVGLLLAALGLFRFMGLGYAELIAADEIRIAQPITTLIAGNGSVLFEYPKGPTEVLTALSFASFGDSYHEFALRFPFAFASVVSVLLLYLLGKQMFSARVGFVAGLLLALEGIYLAQSRFAQYQALVILTGVSAIYCFWRAGTDFRTRARFLLLGSAFFALGCLTHYGGIIVLPVLAGLYLSQQRFAWKREVVLVLACAAIVCVINAPYYSLFFFARSMNRTRSYYIDRRLAWGTGVYNNLQQFQSYVIFTNSTYYVAFMWAALLGALAVLAEKAASKLLLLIAGVSFAAGIVISLWHPNLVQAGNINYAFAFFLPLLVVLVIRKDVPLADRAVWWWFMTGFVILTFFAQQPMTHWYVMSPPWALLAGIAIHRVFGLTEKKMGPSSSRLLWAPFSVLILLFAGYLYLLFVQEAPPHIELFPDHESPLYWTSQDTGRLGGVVSYGVPRQEGWKAIGYLYRTGILRGRLRPSSKEFSVRESLEWYLGHQFDTDQNSRYILYFVDWPPDNPLNTIEQWYTPIGRVLVGGQPKILIYEQKGTARLGPVVDYSFEELEAQYDQHVSLDEQLKLNEITDETSKVYHQAAGLVEATSAPGDMVVFTDRGQVGPFSYHYAGDLPYHIPEEALSPKDLDDWLSAHPIEGRAYVLIWAPPGSAERQAWDAWLATQAAVREKSWYGNVGLAIYGAHSPGPGDLRLLQDSRISDSIQLLGYRMSYMAPTKTVLVTLFWAADSQVGQDYTVFTHLADGQNRLRSQKDNQPVNGTLETSVWRTDKVITDGYAISTESVPPGEYWVDVGMYDPLTGERLPASGQGVTPDRSLRLPVSMKIS